MLRDATAKSIQPDDKPLADGTVAGLRLHPTKTKGRGQWKLRYVSPTTGKRRDIGFGVYPEVSIHEARRLGTEARQLIASSVDPLEERERLKEKAQLEKNILKFEAAAHRVHNDQKAGWKIKKHQAQWISTLSAHVFPTIGSKTIDNITVNDVADALRPVWLTKPETASRVKQRIHQVMEWSCAQGLRIGNPVDGVKHLLPKQPSAAKRVEHHPAMPWRLIPAFVADHIGTPSKVSPALLLFVVLTAVRSGEARHAKWSEFDLKKQIWKIPAERTKVGVAHRVPLAKQTVTLLSNTKALSARGKLVFPSPKAGNVLTDMALTSLLRKHKAPSDVPGRVATAHGFRSSFRDWASENEYPQHLAESALAHKIKNAVERAYHRTDLLEQRRSMMQDWADFVLGKN